MPTIEINHDCEITVPFEITETKTIKADDSEDEFFHFKGYASTFGNVDHAWDVMVKGCFEKSIARLKAKGEDLPTLWQHDTYNPVGVFPTIDMFEDEKGLFVHGVLPLNDTFVKGRVKPQMKVGSVRKMSIGFNIIEATDVKEEATGRWIRNIKDVDLMETSLVTFACNSRAEIIEMKSKRRVNKVEFKGKKLSELESILKENNFSNNDAKEFISAVTEAKKLDAQRDADELEAKEKEREASEYNKSLEKLNELAEKCLTKPGE